ncbi:MAG: 2-oxoacid ferredoxin oxidoreductase [Candidatus Moranbacteria bacterium]|nr:2-oxoacid ferredoxin oxidoreductase [Candidatus Moranbacteria bacterium]
MSDSTDKKRFDAPHGTDIAWCPACGNFPLLTTVKLALSELGIDPKSLVLVSGIGQAAKTPQYVNANMYNGLHGRALPAATGIKLANRNLTVVAESGDGDMYGEGGNHLIHAMRRNPGLTNIVHNNMIYGLTKGQASPTSELGLKNPIQPEGVVVDPFNPMAMAVAMDASFVARANIGDIVQTKEILKQALAWKGYALVDVFQPCVVFNKVNTYAWFKEHTYYLPDDYDPTNRQGAFAKACETEKMPLGVLYKHERPTYEDELGIKTDAPLYKHEFNQEKFDTLVKSYI